jgi:hypothetical protein
MSGTEVRLLDAIGGDGQGDGWQMGLSLAHGGRNELHVIVGEEAEGMAEGLSAEMYERLRVQIAAWREASRALDGLHAFLYEDPEQFPSGADVCEELARVLEQTDRKPPVVA